MSDDHAERPDDRAGPAAPGGPATVPAATGDEGPARCAFSFCRKPLTAAATGRRLEYCRPEDTTWPLGDRDWKCRELGHSEQVLQAITGQAAAADVDTVALSEQIDAVLGPVTGILGPVTALTGALSGVREQLDGAVAAAREETATALRKAADADGRAETEKQNAAEAKATAKKVQENADTVARLAAVDRREKEKAKTAEAVAVGQVTELKERLAKTEERMTGLLNRNETLGADLTTTRAELATTTAELAESQRALAEEQQRATAATTRATELAEEIERQRRDFGTRFEELRTTQQAALDEARADYDRRVTETADAAAALARRQLEDYTRELGTLHRANGELTGQVATLTAQAGTVAARARRAEQAIARLRDRLTGTAEAADELEEPMDPAVLSRTLHTLLDVLPEDDTGEDTAG